MDHIDISDTTLANTCNAMYQLFTKKPLTHTHTNGICINSIGTIIMGRNAYRKSHKSIRRELHAPREDLWKRYFRFVKLNQKH